MRPLEESEIQQVFEKLFKFVKEPEEHRGQGRSAALLQAAQEGAPRFRPSASTSFRPLFSLSWGKSTLIRAPQLQSGVGDDEGNIRASDTP